MAGRGVTLFVLAGLVGDHAEDLDVALAAVQREDERLLDADRAVEATLVTPGLELVGTRDVPGRFDRGFVLVGRDVDDVLHLGHTVGEFQVGGRVVDGVSAEDHERLDLALLHVDEERLEVGDLLGLDRVDHREVLDGLTDVAEPRVERMNERVDAGRLA